MRGLTWVSVRHRSVRNPNVESIAALRVGAPAKLVNSPRTPKVSCSERETRQTSPR